MVVARKSFFTVRGTNMETLRLNNNTYCTVEPCPENHLDDDTKKAERVVVYQNDQKVFTWDVYLNDDTRFSLFFQAEPEFQDGKWLDVIATFEPNSMARWNRPYAVWWNVGEWMEARQDQFKALLETMNADNVLESKTVFSMGAINSITHINQPNGQ
jgi:hypothetical protein